MPYTPEQQAFLDGIYQGATDPDMKMSLLIKATGAGTVTFHSTGLNESGELEGTPDSKIPVTAKIACLEHEVLVQEGLLKVDFY